MQNRHLIMITLVGVLFTGLAALLLFDDSPVPDASDGTDTHIVPVAAEGEPTNRDMLFGAAEGVPITEMDVVYTEGAKGFFARPADDGSYPGIVMIHEWWGLNDNIRDMARVLAGKGYAVLAVDLFGTVASTSDEARAQTAAVDQDVAIENMRDAAAYLREQGSTQLATFGWCFGGAQSLQFSLAEPVDATVIYYGRLETDAAALSVLGGPVLGVFGAEDGSIPLEQVAAFGTALDEAGIMNEVEVYDGVGHAFANPSGPNFAPEATTEAWQKTLDFLERALR